MRFRLVFSIVGMMIIVAGMTMLLPAVVDLIYHNKQSASLFAVTAAVVVGVGCVVRLLAGWEKASLRPREMYFTTVLIWVSFALCGALPYYFSGLCLTFTNAFFESISGLTTTGATVLTGLDTLPAGILFWRSLTQWLGGVGILVFAILVLPMLRIGGMQLFNIEAPGETGRESPTVFQNMRGIIVYFVGITVLCAGCLWGAGMSKFDAVNHAMTTVATGGFSTHDLSIAYFQSPLIEWIIMAFMTVGGLPLVLGLYIVHRRWDLIRANEQIGLFFKLLLTGSVLIAFLRLAQQSFGGDVETIFRTSLFAVIATVTSTGFVADNFSLWGAFAVTFFLFLMGTGACTGSTSGGVKMFRYSVLFKTIHVKLRSHIQPYGVFVPRYGNRSVTEDVSAGVLVFLGLYILSMVVGTLALSLCNLDFMTSLSGTLSALSNVGPGLGPLIGPEKTFVLVPDAGKWILTFLMLLGRLEFVALLILFFPFVWKKNA